MSALFIETYFNLYFYFQAINKYSEPAGTGEDEENAFNIIVTDEMTREDVANKILEITRDGPSVEKEITTEFSGEEFSGDLEDFSEEGEYYTTY